VTVASLLRSLEAKEVGPQQIHERRVQRFPARTTLLAVGDQSFGNTIHGVVVFDSTTAVGTKRLSFDWHDRRSTNCLRASMTALALPATPFLVVAGLCRSL